MIPSSDLGRHVDRYYGKYPGFVADDSDPDVRGVIRVIVPTIFGEGIAVQARPCLPYGHFFVPPPGTPIWVEFAAGDTSEPLWVGVWHPDGTIPPEAEPAPQTERVIRTPFGHAIHISDAADGEAITIRHGGNAFLALQPDGSVILSAASGANLFLNADANATTLQSEAGHLVTMTADSLLLAGKDGAAIEIKGDTVTVLAPKVVVSGTTVALGAGAAEPTLMGTQFGLLWNVLLNHIHPSAMGPTGPSPMLTPLMLQPGVHLTSSVVVK